MSDGVLAITDGTTRIDLLDLFKLVEWTPQTAAPKGGGVWRDSPFLQGRQLVLHEYENIIDTFELVAIGGGSKDVLIENTQNLRRLLEKAVAYWVTDWQNDPVWIETRGICETNTRYAIIHDYRTPNDDNPFADPYVSSSVFEDFTLILEHGLWTDQEPGTGVAVEIGASEDYDGRTLGNVDSAGTFTPTTDDEVYVANKRNVANLTDVYYYDAAPVAWSANLMDAALPFAFLPAVPAVGDIVYYGIDTTLADSGPFCSIVHDIGTAQVDLTITWEYWNGAWVALTVQDNTDASGAMTGDPFDTTGVNSIHWDQPTDWATVAINGITGYWVRARVTAIGAAPSPPTQQNRDMYSVIWSYTDIDSSQIGGDIGALIKTTLDCVSFDRTLKDQTLEPVYKVVVGQRSLERGANFSAFINLSESQWPTGITITRANLTTFVNDPSSIDDRPARFNPGGGLIASQNSVNVAISNTVASQYEGRFRVYVRVLTSATVTGYFGLQVDFFAGVNTNILLKSFDTVYNPQGNANEHVVFDIGVMNIPPDYNLDWGNLKIEINAETTVATAVTMTYQDLILMPVDEWSGDFSTLDGLNYAGFESGDYNILNIDSISNPKRYVQSVTTRKTSGLINSVFTPRSNDFANIPQGKDSRLWFLTYHVGDRSEIEEVSKITLNKQQRYISMRGDR